MDTDDNRKRLADHLQFEKPSGGITLNGGKMVVKLVCVSVPPRSVVNTIDAKEHERVLSAATVMCASFPSLAQGSMSQLMAYLTTAIAAEKVAVP